MLTMNDLTDSSSSDDIDNPISIIKIERFEAKAFSRFEQNKHALKNWRTLRMRLMSHLMF